MAMRLALLCLLAIAPAALCVRMGDIPAKGGHKAPGGKKQPAGSAKVPPAAGAPITLGARVRRELESHGHVFRPRPVAIVGDWYSSGLDASLSNGNREPVCGDTAVPIGVDPRRVYVGRTKVGTDPVEQGSGCSVAALGLEVSSDGYAREADGVRVTPTHGVGKLVNVADPACPTLHYMGPLVHNLESVGLKPGDDLVHLAYDWRRTVENQARYHTQWVGELEKASAHASGLPATVVAHGTGGNNFLHFLSALDAGEVRPPPGSRLRAMGPEAWIKAHVGSLFLVATPLLGSPDALFAAVLGRDELSRFGIGADAIRALAMTMESTAAFSPADIEYERAHPGAQNDIVTVGRASFNADDVLGIAKAVAAARSAGKGSFEAEAAIERFASMYHNVRTKAVNARAAADAPPAISRGHVHVRCFHSADHETPIKARVSVSDPTKVEYENAPGDGTVPAFSASHCAAWAQPLSDGHGVDADGVSPTRASMDRAAASRHGNVISRAASGDHRTILADESLNLELLRHLLVDIVPPVDRVAAGVAAAALAGPRNGNGGHGGTKKAMTGFAPGVANAEAAAIEQQKRGDATQEQAFQQQQQQQQQQHLQDDKERDAAVEIIQENEKHPIGGEATGDGDTPHHNGKEGGEKGKKPAPAAEPAVPEGEVIDEENGPHGGAPVLHDAMDEAAKEKSLAAGASKVASHKGDPHPGDGHSIGVDTASSGAQKHNNNGEHKKGNKSGGGGEEGAPGEIVPSAVSPPEDSASHLGQAGEHMADLEKQAREHLSASAHLDASSMIREQLKQRTEEGLGTSAGSGSAMGLGSGSGSGSGSAHASAPKSAIDDAIESDIERTKAEIAKETKELEELEDGTKD